MYGEPALLPDFVSLPHANPEAPKGGKVVIGNTGGFDSLNPFVLKGTAPWQLRGLGYESLMGRNYGEPFSLYGLLAESIETGPNREWVEFTLREEARFSDGSPVTVDDVIWSYEVLATKGHPRYLGFAQQVADIGQTGPRSLRITFNEGVDRELALIAGLRPILKRAQWEGKDFATSSLDEVPIGTSPYVVAEFEAGRFVSLRRNPDYWGADLPFRRGTHNFDEIRLEFFGDATVMFEAFKAGELSYFREFNAEKWARNYDFPAVQSGEVTKSIIPHQRPSGMTGFVMNTRSPLFADLRVREAMIRAFNFEYINDTLTGGRQPRITSYFSNSELSMQEGVAMGRVSELLSAYGDLPEGALAGYELPVGDGSSRNRKNIRAAMGLLQEAGWDVIDGALKGPDEQPFAFEVVLRQSDLNSQAIFDIYQNALARLGIEVTITTVDSAQYNERINSQDFEMTAFRRGLSLSPGNEQKLYWGSAAADQPGSRNLMGVKSSAVDGLIETMLAAHTREDFIAATRALDRVLTAGRYVIPIYQWNISRVAHDAKLSYHAESLPIYGDWAGFLPDVWWFQDE